jgi:hypothetical protein
MVIDFFDRYLKVEDKLPPVVLITYPRDSAENVSPDSQVWLQFAPVIDEKTVLTDHGIKVVNAEDKTDLGGTWKVSHGGTKFTFIPEKPFKKNAIYNIQVSAKVKDKAGISFPKTRTTHFKVSEGN